MEFGIPDIVALKLGGNAAGIYSALSNKFNGLCLGGSIVYNMNAPMRDYNLVRNPMWMRYDSDAYVSDGPYIGESYNPYEREFSAFPTRLDNVGGLIGYYWNDGYKKMPTGSNGEITEINAGLTVRKIEKIKESIVDNVNRIFERGIYGVYGDDPRETSSVYGLAGLSAINEEGGIHPFLYSVGDENNFEGNVKTDKGTEMFHYYKDNGRGTYAQYDDGDAEYHEVYGDNVYGTIQGFNENDKNGYEHLVKKTNDMFRERIIHSFVSKFSEKSDDWDEEVSRGRRLKAKNEYKVGDRPRPYERTWTAMFQYYKIKNLMTPQRRDHDSIGAPITISELQGKHGPSMRPHDGHNRLERFTSFNHLNIARIAPKDVDDVKRCMFSIENLAWKDIKFKAIVDGKLNGGGYRTITREQTGPNGGRIMWFPPYNLKFSEQVSTKWDQNEFIGRGEKIYTYANTERRGQLDFTILVDHPSMVDKGINFNSSIDANNQDDVNKVLRYLAGIDLLDADGANEKDEETTPTQVKTEPSQTPIPTVWETVKTFVVFFPNNYSGKYDGTNEMFDKLYGYGHPSAYEMSDSSGMTLPNPPGVINGKWLYWVDKDRENEELTFSTNYTDSTGYSLNVSPSNNQEQINKTLGTRGKIFGINDLKTFVIEGKSATTSGTTYESWDWNRGDGRFVIVGNASSHGYDNVNTSLAKSRATSIRKAILSWNPGLGDIVKFRDPSYEVIKVENTSVSSLEAKLARSVVVYYQEKKTKVTDMPTQGTYTDNSSDGTSKTYERHINDGSFEVSDTFVDAQMVEERKNVQKGNKKMNKELATVTTDIDPNDDAYIYDNEHKYFTEIFENDDMIKKNIIEKVKYFDPAFHSITPEGFNARLTFLHQCTRQGPTVSSADRAKNGNNWAGNLSFGRPPFCVLRIGDFYNTKICIDSINITYEADNGVIWDLNQDGIGIQPMFANVTISFTFLGGQDISGPIARLQNAVSYNYYANTSIYDRHSDYRDALIQENNDEANIWVATMNNDDSDSADHYKWSTINPSMSSERKLDYTGSTPWEEYDEGVKDKRMTQHIATREEWTPQTTETPDLALDTAKKNSKEVEDLYNTKITADSRLGRYALEILNPNDL